MSKLASVLAAAAGGPDAGAEAVGGHDGNVCIHLGCAQDAHLQHHSSVSCRCFDGLLWIIALICGSVHPGVRVHLVSTEPRW